MDDAQRTWQAAALAEVQHLSPAEQAELRRLQGEVQAHAAALQHAQSSLWQAEEEAEGVARHLAELQRDSDLTAMRSKLEVAARVAKEHEQRVQQRQARCTLCSISFAEAAAVFVRGWQQLSFFVGVTKLHLRFLVLQSMNEHAGSPRRSPAGRPGRPAAASSSQGEQASG